MREPFARTLLEVLYEDVVPRLKVQDVYEGVRFTAKGPRFLRGGCPLHGGEDANFSVNTETLSWSCFSHCGHGSVVSYLNGGEPARGERFKEIVIDLARRAGVDIEWKATPDSPEVQARLRRRELLEGFALFAQRQLNGPEAGPAIDYLASRGFPADARELSELGLGYISHGARLLEALKATPAEMSSNGLDGRRWRSRVIIPWRDRSGQVGTFLGRSIEHDAEIRYLYLRGAAIPPFFGFERVRLGKVDTLLVVESPLDSVLCWHHGLDHAVAVGGSMLTEKHLEVLRQYGTRTVILALDADDAGRTATDRFVRLSSAKYPELRIQVVPPECYGAAKDPGEYIARLGGAAFRGLLDTRLPAAVYQANEAVRGVHPSSPVAARRDALDRLIVIAHGLAGPERLADIEDIVRVAGPRLGYPEAVVRDALGAVPILSVAPQPTDVPGGQTSGVPLRDVELAFGPMVHLTDQLVQTLEDLQAPLSITMLTHVMRGSNGPATAKLVSRYSTRHAGSLRDMVFIGARELVDSICRTDPRIRLVDGRVSLKGDGAAQRQWHAQPNQGKKWSREDKVAVRRGWDSGRNLGQLAMALGRSRGGIGEALVRMGAVKSLDEIRRRPDAETVPFSNAEGPASAKPINAKPAFNMSRPSAGLPWNLEEDAQLRQELRSGMKAGDMARAHGRSRGSIDSRLSLLGLGRP